MPRLFVRVCLIFVLVFIACWSFAQTDSIPRDPMLKLPLPRMKPQLPGVSPAPVIDTASVGNVKDTSISDIIAGDLPIPLNKKPKKVTWPKSLQTGVTLNQATFSENWKGGGKNTIAMGLFLNSKLAHETLHTTFTNEVQLIYGIVKNESLRSKKSADRIFVDTKFGYKFSRNWDLFFSLNYVSQFDKGYRFAADTAGIETRTLISRFMSPGYLTSSLGIEFKPSEFFWLRFGTGTLRQTFVLDTAIHRNEEQNYGVPVGRRIRNELAFQFVANFDKQIAKNITLKARFMTFANYENLKAIDTRLDVSFTAKVTKYIDVNLTGALLYDEDMDYGIQYSHSLSLGVLYSFSQFP